MIFDMIILLYGVYSIVNSIKMKKEGEPGKWLTGEIPVNKMKDVNGFVNSMYTKTMVLGVVSVLYGVIGIVGEKIDLGPVKIVMLLIFLVFFIVYCVLLHQAKKKYL